MVRSTSETGRAGRTPTTSRDPFRTAQPVPDTPAASIFLVMIDGNGGWSLGFMHEDWKLATGAGFPADADLRWPAALQRSRCSHRGQVGPRPDADQFSADRPIPEGKSDDRLYAGPAVPVQSGSDRAAVAGPGELRRQDQAIRCGQRRGFLGPSRRQAGGRGGAAGFFTGQARQAVRSDRYRLSGEHQRTPRHQRARRPGMRGGYSGQSERRGARQAASGVERRDQRSGVASGHRAPSRTSPGSGTRRSSPATAWWRSAIPSMDC